MCLTRPKAQIFAMVYISAFLLISPHALQAATASIARPVWPLTFEENQGQTDKRIAFLARARSQTLFLTADSMFLRLRNSPGLLRLRFRNRNENTAPIGLGPLSGKVNYFRGSNPAAWQTNIPTFEKVSYRSVYPGIDLVFYGTERQLEYDFVIGPHAKPEEIGFELSSSSRRPTVLIATSGDLIIRTARGEARFLRPTAYQVDSNGDRAPIDCRFSLRAGRRVGFAVGDYDRSKRLVIDPVLTYSTYLGGSDDEGIFGIQRDLEGNLYVSGETSSLDFPILNGAQRAEGGDYDGFIAKFDPEGSHLLYATYLGGSKYDHCVGLAVDALGDAYVAGVTYSSDFPTRNALQDSLKGQSNVFVSRLDASGSQLVFSTYLGGSRYDSPSNIVLDREANIYVAGATQSTDFPVTAKAYQTVCDKGAFPGNCSGDAFITKMDARGSRLIYSTYLGGRGYDEASDIAVDYAGAAYIGGQTNSADFPAVKAYQAALEGQANGFVTKLSPDGSSLVYSTYLGGSGIDAVNGIALDFFESTYVTGSTSSPNFPTVHPFQAKNNGGYSDAFVAKLSSSGSELIYSTYAGGSGWDLPFRIGVDVFGSASIIGFTTSTDFPVRNAIQPKFAGGFSDAFIVKVNAAGTKPVYSTYLGGSGDEYGYALHSDLLGSVWVGGSTSSKDYPVKRAFQPKYAGGPFDAFLSVLHPTISEELDSLQELINGSSEKDTLSDLLGNVRLSIGSGPASVTVDALKTLSDRMQRLDPGGRAAQLRMAVDELRREVRAREVLPIDKSN